MSVFRLDGLCFKRFFMSISKIIHRQTTVIGHSSMMGYVIIEKKIFSQRGWDFQYALRGSICYTVKRDRCEKACLKCKSKIKKEHRYSDKIRN